MKKLLVLFFAGALAASLVSCEKDYYRLAPFYNSIYLNAGTVSAKLNGIDWPFSPHSLNFAYSDVPGTFYIETKLYDEAGLRYQSLSIGNISRSVQTDNPTT